MNYIERLSPDKEESDNNTNIYKEHIIRYKFCLPYIKNKKVLDIACGTGYGSKFISQNQAQEVWGGDISKQGINQAKQKYTAENLHFKTMDATELPFDDNYFDIVISFETIEHLADCNGFLEEVKRVLKPKGKLILSTPNKGATKILNINNPHHLKEFTQIELQNLLDDYFTNIKLFGQRPLDKLSFSQKLLKKIYYIYSKIKILNFLKKIIPEYAIKEISHQIDGLSRNFEIQEIKHKQKYLYFIVVAS